MVSRHNHPRATDLVQHLALEPALHRPSLTVIDNKSNAGGCVVAEGAAGSHVAHHRRENVPVGHVQAGLRVSDAGPWTHRHTHTTITPGREVRCGHWRP
jgi:hypothetical protein